MSSSKYVPLTEEQIGILERNGCCCCDWSQVQVAREFAPEHVVQTAFIGAVRVGKLNGAGSGPAAARRTAGIVNARLNNVSIGDNCFIANVGGELLNLDLGDNVWIENVAGIACTGETAFGNGHEISVLNEGGGRELRITRHTSAQTAYLTVLYRDRGALVDKLHALADQAAAEARSDRGAIGDGARIVHSGPIVNVLIGAHAVVDGATRLEEGTVDSSAAAPSKVGPGVIARDFIMQKGAQIDDGALVQSTLVGEASRLGKQFSAENSVFFANSEGLHSEVCSVFGGPYTVTHHRSTLLIAGLFSFYNAGSGTNQSNHMYKLGPVHQGILERGCKTGSYSYLLFPDKIGAFTAVIGKHYANFDTTDFPFSYIAEEDGKSTLVPAMNYFTVGTLRDEEKWPSRDKRTGAEKLDQIVFDVLSPYTAHKMMRACAIIDRLGAEADRSQTFVTYQGIYIKRLLLKTCGRYYRLALQKYFGDVLARRIGAQQGDALKQALGRDPAGRTEPCVWVDVCGLLCRQDRLEALIEKTVAGSIDSLAALQREFRALLEVYRADEWNAFRAMYKDLHGQALDEASADDLNGLLADWKKASLKLINMVQGDAGKEFEGAVRTGFGIDGNAEADFEAVRGTFAGNAFVKSLQERARTIETECARLMEAVSSAHR